jgi:WD40 repeat protein
MKNTKRLWQIPFEGAWPMAVAFLGPNRVAAGNRDGELIVWDLNVEGSEAPKPFRRFAGHVNGITRLVSTRDGKHLISASLDHTVRIWNTDAPAAETAEVVLDRKTRQERAKKERNDAILSEPGVETGVQTDCEVLKGHGDWVNGLGLSRDGRRLIILQRDRRSHAGTAILETGFLRWRFLRTVLKHSLQSFARNTAISTAHLPKHEYIGSKMAVNLSIC